MMKLIVGLGNPGAEYDNTRHNVGFALVKGYIKAHDGILQQKSKYKSLLAELVVGGTKVIALLPTTYYNASGEAVQAISSFYKVEPQDILIVHDELALPFGSIRTRYGGSDAGNNGVKSVNTHVGEGTARIRVGVYNELRDRIDDADFVLSKFTASELDTFSQISPVVYRAIDEFVADKLDHTTHTIDIAAITS